MLIRIYIKNPPQILHDGNIVRCKMVYFMSSVVKPVLLVTDDTVAVRVIILNGSALLK